MIKHDELNELRYLSH